MHKINERTVTVEKDKENNNNDKWFKVKVFYEMKDKMNRVKIVFGRCNHQMRT